MIPAPVAVARNTSAAASPRTRKPSARSLPPQRHCGGSPTWPARSPPGSPPHTASTTPRTNSRPRPTPPSISFMMASSTRPSRRLEICSNASPTCTTAGIASAWSTRREVIIRRPLIATAKSSTSFEPIPTATTPTSRPSSTSSSISSIHQPPPDRRAPPLTLSEGGAPVPIRYRAQNDRGVPSICVRGVSKRRKAKLYRDMITATRATMASLRLAAQHLLASGSIEAVALRHEAEQYLPLIERVIDQAERRVFGGEAVPSSEKLVSIFETHTDIIVKGGRDVHYGHKLNLTTGRSGLVFDIVVEAGNPADSERFLPMLERHIARQDTAPRQTASDGGYASIANLEQAKALGVDDVVFHKKRGIAIDAMAKSRWVYRKLRNFRAGIEANISCLKRAFGLDRCTWRGLAHFQSYVWSSVVAYNLALFARLAQL